MEIRLSTKRLPRRTTLCLYILCLIFVAGAFYSYLIESRPRNPSFPPVSLELPPFQSSGTTKTLTAEVPLVGRRRVDFVEDSLTTDSTTVISSSINSVDGSISSRHQNDFPSLVKSRSSTRIKGAHETKYVYAVMSNTTTVHHVTKRSTPSPEINSCDMSYKPPKLILLWTSFFDSWDYMSKGRFKRCSCPNCEITTDRSRLLQSDAVIFHVRDMTMADLPPIRLSHQRWVFYCLEAPPYSDFSGLSFMHGMFNWTMTYRQDSDIVTSYGAVRKVYPSRKLDLSSLETNWAYKSKSVIWMSSHCPTDSARDEYVSELRKYIDVDVYGSCGSYNCSQGATDRCMKNFAEKYKFFLAFENSICKDYITEKFFRTLKHDIIPVVFGGAKYEKFAPPGSFVDALSFKSPKHLAFFLAGIGSNFSLYSSYFVWRKDFDVVMESRRECDLCALLHKTNLKHSSYQDLRKWWVQDSKCRTWKPKKG